MAARGPVPVQPGAGLLVVRTAGTDRRGARMRYRTIVADPPWRYEGVPCAPDDRGGARPKRGRVVKRPFPYPTMTTAEIAELPILGMADSDARLFLWATSAYLPDALDIVAEWGFRYVQTCVWRKTGNPSPFGGSVAPNHAEFLLVAKRGSPPLLARLPSNVIECPAAQCFQHSRKPDVFLDLVEQVSPGPYLELFARRARFGWDYWGDESLGTAELESA